MTTKDIYYLSGVIDTLPLKPKAMLKILLNQVNEHFYIIDTRNRRKPLKPKRDE